MKGAEKVSVAAKPRNCVGFGVGKVKVARSSNLVETSDVIDVWLEHVDPLNALTKGGEELRIKGTVGEDGHVEWEPNEICIETKVPKDLAFSLNLSMRSGAVITLGRISLCTTDLDQEEKEIELGMTARPSCNNGHMNGLAWQEDGGMDSTFEEDEDEDEEAPLSATGPVGNTGESEGRNLTLDSRFERSNSLKHSAFHRKVKTGWKIVLLGCIENGAEKKVQQKRFPKIHGWLFIHSRLMWKRRYFVFYEDSNCLCMFRRDLDATELEDGSGYEKCVELVENTFVEKAYGVTSKKFGFNLCRPGRHKLRLAAESILERETWLDALSAFYDVHFGDGLTGVGTDFLSDDEDNGGRADRVLSLPLHFGTVPPGLRSGSRRLSGFGEEEDDEEEDIVSPSSQSSSHISPLRNLPVSAQASALFRAISCLDVVTVRSIICQQQFDLENCTNQFGAPPLHVLFDCSNGEMSSATNAQRRATICEMIAQAHPGAVKKRICGWSRDRSANPCDDFVVHMELRRPTPNLEVIRTLFKECPEIAYLCNEQSGEYPVHVACQSFNQSVLDSVLGSDPASWCLRNNRTLEYPLHLLLNAGRYVKNSGGALFRAEVDDVDWELSYDAITMEEQVMGLVECVLRWSKYAPMSSRNQASQLSKVESCDYQGKSILHYAAAYHSAEVVAKVLNLSPRRLARAVDRNRDTPLHISCRRVSETETLCSIDVFYMLADTMFHDWRNKEGFSPGMLLRDSEVRGKLTSKYLGKNGKPLIRVGRESAGSPLGEFGDEPSSAQSDGEVSPAMRFFGKFMRSLSAEDGTSREGSASVGSGGPPSLLTGS